VETAAYSSFTQVTNQVPVTGTTLALQETSESVPLTFTVPTSAFIDADGEDTLYFTATLADGSPLPAWLSFDPLTRTFSGTPGGGDVGVLSVRVTASDHGLQTVNSDFTLRVLALPVNQPDIAPPPLPPAAPLAPNTDLSSPVVYSEPPQFLQTSEGQSLNIGLSGDIFGDRSRTTDYVEPLTSSAGFRVPVDSSPAAGNGLTLSHPLGDQYAKPDEAVRFTVPADTFMHSQKDAVITLQATRLDGARLPSWLRFDARTGQFFGEPPEDFEGVLEIRVTARDNFGNEVSTIFRIHVKKAEKPESKPLTGRSGLSAQFAMQLHERLSYGQGMPRDALAPLQPRARTERG
jgi:hypothetical protein